MRTDAEILLPFAVHTAKFGYDWSNVPEGMSRAELDACYRVAVARKPEGLEVGQVVSGVAEASGRTFAFSIQVAEAWDANGRNAEYSAFAFASALVADRLDFQSLLERDEFRMPNRTPPTHVPCWIVRKLRIERRTTPQASALGVPRLTPEVRPTVRDDARTDWLNVLIWISSVIVAIVALVAAFKN